MTHDPYADEALAGLARDLPSLPALAVLHVSERALDGLTSLALILFCAVLALLLTGCVAHAEPAPTVEPVPAVRVPLPACEAKGGKCRRTFV